VLDWFSSPGRFDVSVLPWDLRVAPANRGQFKDAMVLLSYLGIVWLAIALVVFLATSIGALLQPFLQGGRAENPEQPAVTAVMPIKLEHSGFAEAQASVFDQNYPEYEVLFSAAEASSPALETALALKMNHPQVPTRILRSQSDFAVSPKLNTLDAPLLASSHDFILVKDSNIILERDTLAAFMKNFAPGVGMVVGVPVAERAESLAGHIEAAILNAHARLLLAASALGFGYGVGKVMLFRRSDIARAGGIDAMSYTLAEDTAIAKGLDAIGLRTVFAHRPLRQLIGWRTLREVYDRQVRWSVIRHNAARGLRSAGPLERHSPYARAVDVSAGADRQSAADGSGRGARGAASRDERDRGFYRHADGLVRRRNRAGLAQGLACFAVCAAGFSRARASRSRGLGAGLDDQ
jgi:ceramide glucosyltransferase